MNVTHVGFRATCLQSVTGVEIDIMASRLLDNRRADCDCRLDFARVHCTWSLCGHLDELPIPRAMLYICLGEFPWPFEGTRQSRGSELRSCARSTCLQYVARGLVNTIHRPSRSKSLLEVWGVSSCDEIACCSRVGSSTHGNSALCPVSRRRSRIP